MLCPNVAAQTPQPAQPQQQQQPPQSDEEEVVRITSSLVQTDVVVTDKDGRQVTDLKPEDFEILENGRPQVITNFSYVSTVPKTNPTNSAAASPSPTTPTRERSTSATPPVPPARLRPEQVQRAIALVVDDLRMSAESVSSTRQALRKYVDEQLQPGDLVAIIRTSAGIGALQQFTSDRQQLHAAIERVRVVTRSTRLGAFTSVNMLERLETQKTDPTMNLPGEQPAAPGEQPAAPGSVPPGTDKRRSENLNEFRDTLFTVGTLGALNFVVRGLKELPGRKAVVLFSDGISIFNQNSDSQDRSERVLSALRQLVDQANRASVVIYSVDTRGLQPTGLTAADSTAGGPAPPSGSGPGGALGGISGITTDQVGQQVLGARAAELFEGQNGLNYLSRETGGIAVFNQNDLNKGIRRALEDISGYYLIGYRPDETTFDASTGRRRFNTWTIKVKNRSNLRVRTRSGFLAVADEPANDKKRTRPEQLMAALLSPFSAGGVNVQLTSFFMNDATAGSTIRSVLLMDARNLTFTAQPDGRQQTVLDVIAVTLGDDGQIVDQVALIETIRVRPEALERFKREGMVYGLNVPISKPGAYQLRIAVRDSVTGRIGSASQYIEVPNVSKDRLTLSSLVITGNKSTASARDLISSVLGAPAQASASAQTPRVVAGGEGMIGTEDPQASPASRRFRHGMFLDYACIVFNAGRNKVKPPQLTTQVRLFRAGQQVFTGEVLPLEVSGQTDAARLVVARRLQLGTILEPGDYVLQLVVTDVSSSGSERTATRWIDFKLGN
ncbi:MAG: VWA domain-containing protein [Rubrivivax sp.]|nr:VWA domain-containing protein [Pyrinomonadaceae bacterium]